VTKQIERPAHKPLHTAFKPSSTHSFQAHTHKMADCPNCTILMAGVDSRLALRCYPCYLGRAPAPAPAPAAERRSRRLAAKPRVSYYDPAIPSEAVIRQRDRVKAERATQRAQDRMVLKALRVKAQCEMAIARQQDAMDRRVKRIMAQLERDEATLAAMPATPPRLQRHNAVTGEAPWAPPHPPALSRTEATGCALPPPSPLRRTCQLPSCDEWCRYCRENDRIASHNMAAGGGGGGGGPASIPPIWDLPPPPIGATVVRVPIDMAQMTAAALQELIAAASRALANK
jgi:hypothetical protein